MALKLLNVPFMDQQEEAVGKNNSLTSSPKSFLNELLMVRFKQCINKSDVTYASVKDQNNMYVSTLRLELLAHAPQFKSEPCRTSQAAIANAARSAISFVQGNSNLSLSEERLAEVEAKLKHFIKKSFDFKISKNVFQRSIFKISTPK